MMRILILLPAAVSALTLAAHFLYGGRLVLVIFCLMLALMLFVAREAWARRFVQIALLLGAVEWMRVAFVLYQERAQAGEPAARMLFILGSVALVTAISAILLQTRPARHWFRVDETRGDAIPM